MTTAASRGAASQALVKHAGSNLRGHAVAAEAIGHAAAGSMRG